MVSASWPAQAWLTPQNAGSPLMVLDGCGPNLAQSCYYVADRDSEEDEEDEGAVDGNGDEAAGGSSSPGRFDFEEWRPDGDVSGVGDGGVSQAGARTGNDEGVPLRGAEVVNGGR